MPTNRYSHHIYIFCTLFVYIIKQIYKKKRGDNKCYVSTPTKYNPGYVPQLTH